MCEANAYLIQGDKEELVMESVDIVEPQGNDSWRLVGIFGDQKIIKGRIKMMNLVDHKIFFESKTD
ncbi:MAG: CooT family nickel-binding protein [Deltaproteobacteria bacterium]|nr:CooT family nickel-binding protein [Deltaproteobacteria bacterium]MBW1923093.1 CooT family nickel-binding protein [Deltaproteobacteria bacterium]MBW1936830.1 CooT family nickel-binding protein [Deltaproteobacteria bacterium]MBW2023534.1 CooT family nickel-binding protein [Deltaproteobacteria bacterium]MBW2302040.1 CooT family nickel-binding protein [Deltaproteobacteria bacterium]